jgi:hypothetical protein
MEAGWADFLRRQGWLVWAERSFSHFGERGRVDLFAWHAATRTALITELKTELGDSQALLGTLDVKTRLASVIAGELGLGKPQAVVRMIVFQESMTNRRHVARLAPLFAAFDLRGRSALTWLRRPDRPAGGLLVFSNVGVSSVREVGKQRVRAPGRGPSVREPSPRATQHPETVRGPSNADQDSN